MAAKKLTKEELENRKKQELAILKAQNELMDYAMESAKSKGVSQSVLDQIAVAKQDNLDAAHHMYNANENSLGNVEYTDKPSQNYIDEYERKYGKKNKDNEDNVTITYGTDSETEEFDVDDFTLDDVNVPEVEEEVKENTDIDISTIPDNVQYDGLPLPSNGQCYKHKKSRLPVGYLTASDENILTSPNLYRDGKILDVLLRRKILDKTVDPGDLVKGDRDAILIWLRADAYGVEMPITVRDDELGAEFETDIRLDKIKTKPFNLIGDENGWFDWTASNGDKLKFKYLSYKDEQKLRNDLKDRLLENRRNRIGGYITEITDEVNQDTKVTTKNKAKLQAAMKMLDEWSKTLDTTDSEDITEIVTNTMIAATMSVNGNTDRNFIRNYILNMRAKDSRLYRDYMSKNEPGMDLKITVNKPESLGGGSVDTFLEVDPTILLRVKKL